MYSLGRAYSAYTDASDRSRTAAASTMFLTELRLMALSWVLGGLHLMLGGVGGGKRVRAEEVSHGLCRVPVERTVAEHDSESEEEWADKA